MPGPSVLHAIRSGTTARPLCGGKGVGTRAEVAGVVDEQHLQEVASKLKLKPCQRCTSILDGTRRVGRAA